MNIVFIKYFFVGFMVSEIQRVSVFGHCPSSVTFPYRQFFFISMSLPYLICNHYLMNL